MSNTRRPTSRLTGWNVHTSHRLAGYWRGIGRSCARSPLHTYYHQCAVATSPATDGMYIYIYIYIYRICTNRRYLQQRKQDCWKVNRKDVKASGCGPTGSTAAARHSARTASEITEGRTAAPKCQQAAVTLANWEKYNIYERTRKGKSQF